MALATWVWEMNLIGQSEEPWDPYPLWLPFARREYFCLGVNEILLAFYEIYVMIANILCENLN